MRGPQSWKTNRARTLRATATSAENVLWFHLRNRHLNGFKFVRQAPVNNFFPDFLCRERKLIVEIDGGTHGEHQEVASDARRTHTLENLGYRVLRFDNNDVYENADGVLELILAVLENREQ